MYFFQTIYLHLFITAFSIPILICWGLPLSILSGIGNFIFSPFLTVFLFVSSLIFFTQLLYIPNGILITVLEYITNWWDFLLRINVKHWLMGFPLPPLIMLAMLPLGSLLIAHHPRINHPVRGTIALSLLFIIFFGIIQALPTNTGIHTIAYHEKPLTLITTRHHTILCDPGYLGSRLSSASWTQYTLIPEIIKKTGTLTIDHCVCLQPSMCTFQALATLVEQMHVGKLYIPYWEGTISRTAWRSYKMLREACAHQGTTIVRLPNSTRSLYADDNCTLTITPLNASIMYQESTFPALAIEGSVDNTPLTLYAAKRTSKNQKEKKNDERKSITRSGQ
jgi:hypothetical protein